MLAILTSVSSIALRMRFGYLPPLHVNECSADTYELAAWDVCADLLHIFKVKRYSSEVYDTNWDSATDETDIMYKPHVYHDLRAWFAIRKAQTQSKLEGNFENEIEVINWLCSGEV